MAVREHIGRADRRWKVVLLEVLVLACRRHATAGLLEVWQVRSLVLERRLLCELAHLMVTGDHVVVPVGSRLDTLAHLPASGVRGCVLCWGTAVFVAHHCRSSAAVCAPDLVHCGEGCRVARVLRRRGARCRHLQWIYGGVEVVLLLRGR